MNSSLSFCGLRVPCSRAAAAAAAALFALQNPGFDFSGAEFNGQVPDARTFMGGVKYT